MELTLIKTCPGDAEAHLIRTKLESEGITCFLFNEHFSNLIPAYYQMMGSGIQIRVPSDQADAARQVIETMYPSRIVACPNCQSQRIKSWEAKHRLALISFLLILPTLIGNLFGRYTCQDCGTVFRGG
jgi:hypothetical protein